MSESTPEQTRDLDSAPTPQPAQTERRPGSLSSKFAMLLSAIALIASGYLWYTLFYVKEDLMNTDVAGTIRQLDKELAQLRQELTENLADNALIKDTQETLKTAVEGVNKELGRNRTEWVLAETEQLLLIANHRLQLARDVTTAVTALRTADNHLKNLADPSLLPVRKILAQEIAQLESLGQPDIPGIALRLGALANTVERLPLAVDTLIRQTEMHASREDEKITDADEPPLTRQIWNDIRSLVRIQSSVQVQKPLLTPEQHYFLRQNLRLMLNSAQLALMQNNVDTYKQNITQAKQWVNDYFDNDTQVVQHAKIELDRLLAEKLLIEHPDISGSLKALRSGSSRKTGL